MLTEQLSAAWRARTLASDRRAGSWARGRAWSEQLAFVGRNWLRLGAALLLACLVTLPGVWLVTGGFARGFIAGVFLTTIVASLWAHVVRASGAGAVMMGDLAEQWTASELRGLRSQGWRLVNGVRLGVEIDHVLIGPGGVVVVESKWSSRSWSSPYGRERVTDAVAQVRRGARQLRWLTDLRRCGIDRVDSVVVLWGPDARDVSRVCDMADATPVIAGDDIGAWSRRLPSGVFTKEQIDNAWTVLDAQCRKTDAWSALNAASPPSLTLLVILVAATGSSALTGLVVAARCLAAWDRLGWGTLALLVPSLALAPVFDRVGRFRVVRPVVWGWTLGVAVTVPLWAITTLYEIAR